MDSLLKFVLELYRVAQDTLPTEFPDLALEMLKAVVPFRTATWSQALLTPCGKNDFSVREIFSVHLHNEPPEMRSAFAALNKTHTRAVVEGARRAGEAIRIHAPTLFKAREDAPMRDYVKRYGHDHALLITDSPRSEWLSCYRPGSDDPYTEMEAAIASALLPHMVEALAINRALVIGDGAADHRHSSARALVDRNGVFLHCGAKFLELLRREWPDWSTQRLPPSLWTELCGGERVSIADGSVSITPRPVGTATLLTGGRISALGRLSPRELVIAREFGVGKSHKTIAQETQLAPATVRNMLQNAYRKLGIDNKAALARLLEGEARH